VIEALAMLFLVTIIARVCYGLAGMNAASRHARYRLRVKLARWVMGGQLREVKAKHGRIVSVRGQRRGLAAKRTKVLSVVRRRDSAATGTES